MPNPTYPAQRSETRTEWRNVYEDGVSTEYETREDVDWAERHYSKMFGPRIAVEERTTTVIITRHPLGGTEETMSDKDGL